VVELDFLADHGFALDHQLGLPRSAQVEDDAVGLLGGLGPMHLDAVGGQIGFELFQQLRQPGQAVLADLLAELAQALQFFVIGELGRALLHQKIHRPPEAGLQLRVVDHGLGAPLETGRRVEMQRGVHACAP